jgi:hypothetical protein
MSSVYASRTDLDHALAKVVRCEHRASHRSVFEDAHGRGVDVRFGLEVEQVDVPCVPVVRTGESLSVSERSERDMTRAPMTYVSWKMTKPAFLFGRMSSRSSSRSTMLVMRPSFEMTTCSLSVESTWSVPARRAVRFRASLLVLKPFCAGLPSRPHLAQKSHHATGSCH